MRAMRRREFLRLGVVGGAGLGMFGRSGVGKAQVGGVMRAAVIGHTGRGDYGHGLDRVFGGVPGVELVAVADADEAGRGAAMKRLGLERGYGDYRAMLAAERPALVSVAPRHADEHHAMVTAALESGAHVICEKPFTLDCAEADELLALADERGLKMAVAHQMRIQPSIVALRRAIDGGEFGDLIALRAWGKQDARAGGEDMMVLGTHLFDLMRLFAGDPEWCTARVRLGGRDIVPGDARIPKDNVGPVAGDDVFAEFSFAGGVHGSFTSHGGLRERVGRWGIELHGTKGAARICADIPPDVFILESGGWDRDGRIDRWTRPGFAGDPSAAGGSSAERFDAANRLVVDDWLAAIREPARQPECGAGNAARAVEMVMAVYAAALSGARVAFPLEQRRHPLTIG